MRRLLPLVTTASWIIIAGLLAPSTVVAHTAAGLGVDYAEELDSTLRSELQDAVVETFDESPIWIWLPDEEGWETLDDELKGCFDEVCLLETAGQLDATLGVTVEVEVEADIYEWTIEFYDLLAGESVVVEHGECALCGRAEVVEEFRTTLQSGLASVDTDDEPPREPAADEPPSDPVDDGPTAVQITGLPDTTEIHVDGQFIDTGDTTVEFEQGHHEIEFVGQEHDDFIEELVVDADTPTSTVLRVSIPEQRPELNTILSRGDAVAGRLGATRHAIGWTAIGTGALATGGSFVLAGLHGQPACPDGVEFHRCSRLYNTAALATTTTIFGVLSMIAGATLVAWPALTRQPEMPGDAETTGESDGAAAESSFQISPAVTGDFGGVSIGGRF